MTSADHIDWNFSVPLSKTVFCGKFIDVVVHLGHDWGECETNIVANQTLLEAAKHAGIPKFVFCSSILARKNAPNQYGRVKKEIEEYCAKHGAIIARIGLVYGGPQKATWGLLNRIVRWFPVIPMVGQKSLVYPIHLDDVARGLLKLVEEPAQVRQETVVLANHSGITFSVFLRDVAFILHKKRRIFLHVPVKLILAVIRLINLFNRPPIVDPERILGLSSMRPTILPIDLSIVGFSIQGFPGGLWMEKAALYEERLKEEAAIMLRYAGGRQPSANSVKVYCDFVRASAKPWPILKFPFWLLSAIGLRCLEPIGLATNVRVREFRKRLMAAAIIEDKSAKQKREPEKQYGVLQGLSLVIYQFVIEGLLVPVRGVLGRFLV